MEDKVWLYDGEPEYVGINIADATPEEGGYLVALELEDGTTRLVATRQPAKYIAGWKTNVRRFGAPEIIKVRAAGPFLQYERIKRTMAGALASYLDESGAYRIDESTLDDAVSRVISALQS